MRNGALETAVSRPCKQQGVGPADMNDTTCEVDGGRLHCIRSRKERQALFRTSDSPRTPSTELSLSSLLLRGESPTPASSGTKSSTASVKSCPAPASASSGASGNRHRMMAPLPVATTTTIRRIASSSMLASPPLSAPLLARRPRQPGLDRDRFSRDRPPPRPPRRNRQRRLVSRPPPGNEKGAKTIGPLLVRP